MAVFFVYIYIYISISLIYQIPFPNPEQFLSGGKFIYTSPLKALSAQKRREFAQIFGPEAVGLVPLANKVAAKCVQTTRWKNDSPW